MKNKQQDSPDDPTSAETHVIMNNQAAMCLSGIQPLNRRQDDITTSTPNHVCSSILLLGQATSPIHAPLKPHESGEWSTFKPLELTPSSTSQQEGGLSRIESWMLMLEHGFLMKGDFVETSVDHRAGTSSNDEFLFEPRPIELMLRPSPHYHGEARHIHW